MNYSIQAMLNDKLWIEPKALNAATDSDLSGLFAVKETKLSQVSNNMHVSRRTITCKDKVWKTVRFADSHKTILLEVCLHELRGPNKWIVFCYNMSRLGKPSTVNVNDVSHQTFGSLHEVAEFLFITLF